MTTDNTDTTASAAKAKPTKGRTRKGPAKTARKTSAKGKTAKRPAKATPERATAVTPAPEATEVALLERSRKMDEVFGQVAGLMMRSPRHKHLFLADLEWLVQPPLALGQARVLRDEHGNPLAFACWASVSHEVGQRLATGNPRLTPNEWASGDTLWLIDVIAPDAAIPGVLKTLQEQVFKGQKVRTMFKAPGGKGAAEPVASTEV